MRVTIPRAATLTALLLVTACGARTVPFIAVEQPRAELYGAALPAGDTAWSNESLAEAFTLLTHGLEWGASRPNLVRFEGPVRVAITGQGSHQYLGFLETFLADLAARTGIDIALGSDADLLVRLVPGASYAAYEPNQCFFVMGQPSWQAFLREGSAGGEAFERATTQSRLTIFMPDTHEPYKIRECLIEEITQALGPGNDLYGLGPSIFNDDNAHTWPTAVDYLMLRVLYDPRIRTGLDRDETQARARVILDEINPEGRSAPPLPPLKQGEMIDWRNALHAMPYDDDEDLEAAQIRTARSLVREAEDFAPGSAYHCTALWTLADIRGNDDPEAMADTDEAIEVCAEAHGQSDVRISLLKLRRAFALFASERYGDALKETEGLEEAFLGHKLEDRLVATYALRWASASLRDGQRRRQDLLNKAVAWGAYAYGDDNDIVEDWRLY